MKGAAYHLDRYYRFTKMAEEQEEVLKGMSKDWTYSRWTRKARIRKYRFIAQQHLDEYNQIVIHSLV